MVTSATLLIVVCTGEVAPQKKAWLSPQPAYAEKHYGQWRTQYSDWAHPGWHRFWLSRRAPQQGGVVVEDLRHSRKQGLSARLRSDAYQYKRMHGMGLLADLLEGAGVETRTQKSPLTGYSLGGAGAVFLNLPSGDGPPFTHAEVVSLISFVRSGGGLVVLTDHTNVYYHAEMLSPLAERLGFSIPPVTACDKAFGHTMSPKTTTWIVPRTRGQHPILKNVARLGLMTAGSVRPVEDSSLSVLASTSNQGWEDYWHPYRKPESAGFTGNMAQDSDESDAEVPVLLAGEIGKGRVVVLSDQNAWGTIFLGVEDNAQLAMNAMAWASGREELPTVSPANLEFVSGETYACGTVSRTGFHTFYVSAARVGEQIARPQGTRHACRAKPGSGDSARVWLPGSMPSLEDLEQAERSVVIVDPSQKDDVAAFEALGWTVQEGVAVEGQPQWHFELPKPEHPVMQAAAVSVQLRPVLLDVGESLLTIGEQTVLSLWRTPGGREVLVVLDAALFQNGLQGKERANPMRGDAQTQTAQQVAYRVLAWAYGMPQN